MDPKLLQFGAMKVPRYTSYPTAPHFSSEIGAPDARAWLGEITADHALSLYLHVPFCNALCHYCGCHTRVVNRPEPMLSYADLLCQEIALVGGATGRKNGRRPQVVHLHWGGGTPSLMPASGFDRILDALDSQFDLSGIREHAIELDPRTVTRDLVRRLVDAGLNRASLGVQDFSPRVQKAIGRLQPFGIVAEAARLLRTAGIDALNFDLMYGLPAQTVHDVRRTAALAASVKPNRIALFGYAHVPWFAKNQQLIDDSLLPDAAARLEQSEAAADALVGAGYRRIGFDHYALPSDDLARAEGSGQLARNFQGYTTDTADALIGFGASSVGRLPAGYVQNTPDMTAYRTRIESGDLATVRGLSLSDDDKLRGAVIERLMCDMTVDLDEIAGAMGTSAAMIQPEAATLAPLSDAGLVEFDGHVMTVTEAGRPFVRLAAASFDRYLSVGQARHSEAV